MSGKWDDPAVPHKGWQCINLEDLGEPAATCEMCEVMTIRYVHYMEHPNHPEVLRCGCICAGNMELDLAGARARETAFKASRARRKKWLTRRWTRTLTDVRYLNVDGFHVSVWPRADGSYAGKIEHRERGETIYSKRHYDTMDEVKLAAFDAMIRMKGRKSTLD